MLAYEPGEFAAVVQVKLPFQTCPVAFDRAQAQVKPFGYLPIRESFRYEGKNGRLD
jgi:hypothetical protein